MLISVVIPVFNEYEVLPHLFAALPPVLEKLGDDYEILLVNDGSQDGSVDWIRDRASKDHRVKLISFSRNFGQQAAMTAGLDAASGDVVAVMDSDLQDPPELLEQMLEKINDGYDVVSCQRASRAGETLFKKVTATAFYELMRRGLDRRIPPEVGDFRMYSRNAVEALCGFREQHRFMRGLVAWLGLKEAVIPFHRPPRVAGETKYPVSKLFRLAWTAISSSSALPLKFCTYVGMAMLVGSLLTGLLSAVAGLGLGSGVAVPYGWIGFQLFLSGIQLSAIGLLGDYVGRIYEESKQRPLYIVDETCNLGRGMASTRSVWLHPDNDTEATDMHESAPYVIAMPGRVPAARGKNPGEHSAAAPWKRRAG
jgi:dolichol-phosphate mannosyltransferase